MQKTNKSLPIKWLSVKGGPVPCRKIRSNRRRQGGFTLLELTVAVSILALLAVIAFPSYVHARANSERTCCLNNLRQIDEAKQQWGLENNKPGCATPLSADLAPYLRNKQIPSCPSAGVYTIGNLTASPTCNIAKHAVTGN